MLALVEMYVEGVSTRKVQDMTEARCGMTLSKSAVSSLVGPLDAEPTAWCTRRLDDILYPHLVVDARSENVRCESHMVSQGVRIVAGVREDGKREHLFVDVAGTEGEATYQEGGIEAAPGPLLQRPLHRIQVSLIVGHGIVSKAECRHPTPFPAPCPTTRCKNLCRTRTRTIPGRGCTYLIPSSKPITSRYRTWRR